MVTNADSVFIGGTLFSAGQRRSSVGAVAVREGRIVAIGSDDEIRSLVGKQTDVIDLDGGLLMPGFQDAHVHPVIAGVTMLRCDLHGCESIEQTIDTITRYASAHPELEWIIGGGWSMEHFLDGTPTRGLLDSLVADRPVYLTNRDGHGAWVNTAAIERAGLTAATADPTDGRIEREADGFPAGTLHEGAVGLVDHLLPTVGLDEQLEGLELAQDYLFSMGITSWQDAAVGEMFGQEDILAVYLRAVETRILKARVVGSLWWDRNRGSEQIPELIDRRGSGTYDRFRPTTIKIMQDGVAENFTAGMIDPYLDGCGCQTENNGLSMVDPEGLKEYVSELDAAGFQIHFHALGDRAVREALDSLEVARTNNGPTDGRHHLAHLQVVHPEDIPRFAELDVTANIQPLWAAHEPQMDTLTIPFLGERRSSWQYPFADLERAGARLAAGSDWSVSSPDPLQGIHVAVNRTSPDAPEGTEPLYAHNALSLASALSAYTAGTARVNHHEDRTGHLKVGMLADLVVLDRDPFDDVATSIAAARVRSTFVEGERVFERN